MPTIRSTERGNSDFLLNQFLTVCGVVFGAVENGVTGKESMSPTVL